VRRTAVGAGRRCVSPLRGTPRSESHLSPPRLLRP
jgi:hypothetical protein